MTKVSCSVAQPIILRASILKEKTVQYMTGYTGEGKAYKKEKVLCMYIGPLYKMLVDLF